MNENNRNNNSKGFKEKWEELQGFHRAAPILLVALAASSFATAPLKTVFSERRSHTYLWDFSQQAPGQYPLCW